MKKLVLLTIIFIFVGTIAETHAQSKTQPKAKTEHIKQQETQKTTATQQDKQDSTNANNTTDKLLFFVETFLTRSWEFPSSQTISIFRS